MELQQGTALRLHGELDDEACASVRRRLAPLLAQGLQHLVIDLSNVHALTSDGVRLFTGLDQHLRRQGGGLILIHANPMVGRSVRVHELGDLLDIRDRRHAERPTVVDLRDPAESGEDVGRLAGVVPLTRRVTDRFRPAEGGQG
jgi:anti-anti-sigma factor